MASRGGNLSSVYAFHVAFGIGCLIHCPSVMFLRFHPSAGLVLSNSNMHRVILTPERVILPKFGEENRS